MVMGSDLPIPVPVPKLLMRTGHFQGFWAQLWQDRPRETHLLSCTCNYLFVPGVAGVMQAVLAALVILL